ncbi:E3 ubiquitin-protein ligase SHPRH isoform X2 [Thrips palmi]|nr:E3 ubiquitin-protein ligase SHPRH isoform X2 [Thrips palmi]
MGLGKTVEVLACVLHNPRIDVVLPQDNSNLDSKMEGESDSDEETLAMRCRQSAATRKKNREMRAKKRAQKRGESVDFKEPSSSIGKSENVVMPETLDDVKVSEPSPDTFLDVKVVTSTTLAKKVSFAEEALKEEAEIKTEECEIMVTDDNDAPLKKNSNNKKLDSGLPKKRTKAIKRSATDIKESCKRPKSASRQLAQLWYESKLSEVHKNPIRAAYEALAESSSGHSALDVQCICTENQESQLTVTKCEDCSRLMHKECIGATKWIGSQPVYCPQCWLKKTPVKSRATLIVSPTSISGQWLQEVKKHISVKENFKVLVYKGVKTDGFLQPYFYADYDLILTTYDVLRRELVLSEVHKGRSLRFEKRYFTPTCPLLCVDFWRICLDEAQMVEGTASKAAEMVSRLSAVHRWAVTGTPIQKSLHDLYGLILFLCVEPYSDHASWTQKLYNPYCTGIKYPLYTLLAHIMWRSSKVDVLDQIKIPPQSELLWWLNFTPVEEHFYLRTHQECSNDFLERLSKFHSLSETLHSFPISTVNHVLGPLLKLRQACSHPQAVRGNVIANQKNTMTMTELLESLIKKTTIEAQDALRKHIASLNGMAGLHIICNEYVSAAEKYREVLRITEEYKERFKVDTLQKIHTLNNLAEVIENHREIIPPTLRDDKLREEAKQLEENYMSKAQLAVTSVEESLVGLSEAVVNLENQISNEDGDWWIDLCQFLDRDEILSKVYDALVNHRKSIHDVSSTSIIKKVATIPGLQLIISQWLEGIEKNQKKVKKSLKALKAADNEVLVNAAVDCHLRISNLKSKSQKALCELCVCENYIKKFEVNLFDIKVKKNENIMVGDVYLLGQGKEGSWKPSEQETVLKTLLSLGRHRKADKDWLKSGSLFLKLMEALRKEFKSIRLLWSRVNERTQAQDELNMCNLRLRLRYPDEPMPNSPTKVNKRKKQESKNLSSNIDTKMETLHVIEPHQVEGMTHQNNLEAISAFSELRKKSGTVAYLENLRSKGNDPKSSPEVCPVCQATLENKWVVLSCGHCYCMDCFPELMKKTQVPCAICREVTNISELSFVNLGSEEECVGSSSNLEIPPVLGSYSTKVEGVVKRLFYLKAADPLVKVLIFSTWDRVLDVLQEALNCNSIKNLRLKSGAGYEQTLQRFKDMEEENPVTALLLLLKLGSKGLNLTEATHVMLVEPLLNPADELQAIGRIHRIGQTRQTYVHRFLIRETIEDRMFSAVQATGKEQWSGKQVTLQQLKDLFSSQTSNLPAQELRQESNASIEEVTIDG